MNILTPKSKKQEMFLSSTADIAIYGGGAGSGKTYALILEPLRNIYNALFRCVFFRRQTTQIRNAGGLWDSASPIYSSLGANIRESNLEVDFKSGAKIKFAHLEYEKDAFSWQGSQICLECFDELTHFTEGQFFYLLSRNRSVSGIKPYVRATCNPDPDSFVKKLISYWLDADQRYADESKAGKLRYFLRQNNNMIWGDSYEEVYEKEKELIDSLMRSSNINDYKKFIKSLTFIPANVYDNQVLLESDPSYLANLQAQTEVIKERLLKGNWQIKPSAGSYFRKEWFPIINGKELPSMVKTIRVWDLASTEESEQNRDPDYTAGTLVGLGKDGKYYILDARRDRLSPGKVESFVYRTAYLDGKRIPIYIPQDPGQAGKAQTWNYQRNIKELNGHIVESYRVTKDKETMASPVSALASRGQVVIVAGEWNKDFLTELENFPEGSHDDYVDNLSNAWFILTEKPDALEFLKRIVGRK